MVRAGRQPAMEPADLHDLFICGRCRSRTEERAYNHEKLAAALAVRRSTTKSPLVQTLSGD